MLRKRGRNNAATMLREKGLKHHCDHVKEKRPEHHCDHVKEKCERLCDNVNRVDLMKCVPYVLSSASQMHIPKCVY